MLEVDEALRAHAAVRGALAHGSRIDTTDRVEGSLDIDLEAPILAEAGIDFAAYARLAEVLKNHLPETPQTALPNG